MEATGPTRVAHVRETTYECVERTALFGLIRWMQKVKPTSVKDYLDVSIDGTEIDSIRVTRDGKYVWFEIPDEL